MGHVLGTDMHTDLGVVVTRDGVHANGAQGHSVKRGSVKVELW